jgi:hypothetical protein
MRKARVMGLLMVTAAVALCAARGASALGFSVASVKGAYAATFHGTTDGTGNLIADGAGNITGGSETVNDGTNICVGSITGSYTVNPDGTGTLTTMFVTTSTIAGVCPASAVTNHAAIVVVSRKRVEVSGTDPGLLESGSLTRQTSSDDD